MITGYQIIEKRIYNGTNKCLIPREIYINSVDADSRIENLNLIKEEIMQDLQCFIEYYKEEVDIK